MSFMYVLMALQLCVPLRRSHLKETRKRECYEDLCLRLCEGTRDCFETKRTLSENEIAGRIKREQEPFIK